VVMAEGPAIQLHDLPTVVLDSTDQPAQVLETKPGPVESPADPRGKRAPAAGAIEKYASELPGERQSLVEALARANGNKAEAARILGIPRSTFFSRLKKFGME